MASVIIFVLASALIALLFSRVHFHFSFNCSISRSGSRLNDRKVSGLSGKPRRAIEPGEVLAPAVRSISSVKKASQDSSEADLVSALLNLGCSKGKALEVAKKAIGQGKDFDSRLKWALQNAA